MIWSDRVHTSCRRFHVDVIWVDGFEIQKTWKDLRIQICIENSISMHMWEMAIFSKFLDDCLIMDISWWQTQGELYMMLRFVLFFIFVIFLVAKWPILWYWYNGIRTCVKWRFLRYMDMNQNHFIYIIRIPRGRIINAILLCKMTILFFCIAIFCVFLWFCDSDKRQLRNINNKT